MMKTAAEDAGFGGKGAGPLGTPSWRIAKAASTLGLAWLVVQLAVSHGPAVLWTLLLAGVLWLGPGGWLIWIALKNPPNRGRRLS